MYLILNAKIIMECLRRICCIKKYKTDVFEEDDLIPAEIIHSAEPSTEPRILKHVPVKEPESFFRSSVLSIYKNVDSMYKQVSEWSLPKRTHVNLFALSSDDIDEFEENGFFDDVVDEKF